MIKYLITFILFTSQCLASMGIGGFPYPGPGTSQYLPPYDFCVREDGTATKSSGTNCINASTSMSVDTFNASTFFPGQTIYFSDRGGPLTRAIILPSSGVAGNIITYSGEPGHVPTIAATNTDNNQNGQSYIDWRDMIADAANIANFNFEGTAVGVTTHNLVARNAANQCLQHLGSVQVDHYNLTTSGAADEGLSMHDSPTVRVFGGSISGYNGINWVGTGTLKLYDVPVRSENAAGYALQPAAGSYDFGAYRSHFIETPGSAKRAIDFNAPGNVEFFNCSFRNLGSTDYYMLLRSTLTSAKLINSVFYGGSITGAVVFNQLGTGIYTNNAFHTATAGAGKAYYQSTGINNTGYYLSGSTYYGSTYTTTDPLFISPSTGDFHTQTGSPLIDHGANMSAYFLDDVDGDARQIPWDIGLDEHNQ